VTTTLEPSDTAKHFKDGGVWIQGRMGPPPENAAGPLVFGADWLLEMVRMEKYSRTLGFFWAPYAIIGELQELNDASDAEFVGFSRPGEPPAPWLTTSVVFNLGDLRLPRTPEDLIALVAKPHPCRCIEAGQNASRLARKAKRLISKTYGSDMALAKIAAQAGVSHAHLTRQFKRDFGITPIAYRNGLRVSEAIGRLSKGQDILDVGYEVGFNDTSRFYDDFRKVTGTSPGKCRDVRTADK
jgi:AraC-like DNA-binding protein